MPIPTKYDSADPRSRLKRQGPAGQGGPCAWQVEALLHHFEPIAQARVAWIAAQCGLASGTLQARLAREKMTFRALVKRETHRRAKWLLLDDALDLQDIATILGFANVAGFTRAFRREIGLTPRQYRQFFR